MRLVMFFTMIIGLSGCFGAEGISVPTVSADFRYSNAGGFGTQNAGFLVPGQMFVWDIRNNELEPIATLPLVPSPGNTTGTAGSQSSTGVSGVAVSGIPTMMTGQEALIEASIGAQSTYTVSGASREIYLKTVTAMSNYVRGLVAAGANPDLIFHPRNDDYRIVLINSILRASSSTLSIGGTDASDPTKIVAIRLNTPVGEIGSVGIRAGSNTTCGLDGQSGQPPACFFSVIIRDPHYEEGNSLLQFRNIPSPKEMLPEAFKRLR